MKALVRCLGVAAAVLGLWACTAKENPDSSGSSFDLSLTPPNLTLSPGESGTVTYLFTAPVTNPQVLAVPTDGLEFVVTPGGQSGTIKITLSSAVTEGPLTAIILAVDGENSVQKEITVTVKAPDPVTPVDPSSKRRIRTIKVKEGSSTYHYAWFEYDNQNRVSKAKLSQSGKYTYYVNYTYPTQSSVVATVDDFSVTFFISNGQLLSISESDGDKWSFEYDKTGRLSSSDMDGSTYTWSGNDMASCSSKYDFVEEFSYSQSQDKYGFSFVLSLSAGDLDEIEEYFMAPILSGVTGLNSEHLLQTIRFTGSGASGSPYSSINFDYSLDSQGYPKTILTDNGYTLYIWYTDEPESDDENIGSQPVDPSTDIKDVSGREFWNGTPSSTQLYRLRGVIDYIYDKTYGNFYIKTEDGYYINIYGASSNPIGYGGSPDKTFASRRLRKGDEVIMVGYCYNYDGGNEMEYGYVESSYRLQMSDFEGPYTIYLDMEEYVDGYYYFNDAEIDITGSNLEVHGLDGYSSEHYSYWPSAAIAEYDDETGCITLIGGYFRSSWSWHYTSNPDQAYMSIFYPVVADTNAKTYEYYDRVSFGEYNARGIITLQPRSEFRGTSEFGLERAGTGEQSQYIFTDYYYDRDSSTLGQGQYRSNVWQFYYMTKDTGSSSSIVARSAGKPAAGAVRADVRPPYAPPRTEPSPRR